MMNNFNSFRDPAGRLVIADGRILRFVKKSATEDLCAILTSAQIRKFITSSRLVKSEVLDDVDTASLLKKEKVKIAFEEFDDATVLEHERIPLASFPCEWPPEMLHAAGSLTLDLAEAILEEGIGLKDATPFNVLFKGPDPVFVDLMSFERRDPGDPRWLPYSQFVRTFLLPLLVNKYFSLPLAPIFLSRREGLEPEEVYRLSGPALKFIPLFLTLVSLPVWLAKQSNRHHASIYRGKKLKDAEMAKFILRRLFKRMRRTLDRLVPQGKQRSHWSGYTDSNSYSQDHLQAKRAFVEAALNDFLPKKVLDVGCNTGFFSEIAARTGASVVAIDYDPVVVGEVWKRARNERLDILPLVVNLASPTPALGWCNGENPSFLDRAYGAFDTVLMLAVIHHMLVTDCIPLTEIIDLAARMTSDLLIVEFVSPGDPMFTSLARGRDHLHASLTAELFERTSSRRFDIVRSQHLDNTSRWLYVMRKKKEGERG